MSKLDTKHGKRELMGNVLKLDTKGGEEEMAKESGFNLVQILNQRSRVQEKGEETGGTEEKGKSDKMEPLERQQVMMIDVDNLIPSNENFYQVDDSLKQSIELAGVLQPLLVDRLDDGKYKVLAGHRRRLAVLSLIEEGKEERRYVPCVCKEENVTDRLAIIMANRFREKTDWEKMMEIIEVEKMAQELKQDYGVEGRTRDVTARIMGISQAQIGRYKAIHKNLNKGLMEKFKDGILGFSVVSELCSLPGQWQKKAEKLLKENGNLSLPDIKILKTQKEEEETGQKPFLLPPTVMLKAEDNPKAVSADNRDAGVGVKKTENMGELIIDTEPTDDCQDHTSTEQGKSRNAGKELERSGEEKGKTEPYFNKEISRTKNPEHASIMYEDIRGYAVKSDEVNQWFVYVYPIMYPYSKEGEKTCIKYSCPICERFGNRHILLEGIENCPFCGINLGWGGDTFEEGATK